MATKAYLSEEDFEEGKRRFLAPSDQTPRERRLECSAFLAQKLENRMRSLDGWEESKPILLGSWARNELCPKSDVDLLLIGGEGAVSTLVSQAQNHGIKIRSRMPQDPNDWSAGVEPFDVLALHSARALSEESAAALKLQQERLFKSQTLKRKILSSIRKERLIRQKRHDSVSNYLEPQLKFGAGGLRDLEQAINVGRLFPDKFHQQDKEAFQKIADAKDFLLCLRQLVHWFGGGDVLAAGFQAEIAKLLGYTRLSELMKELQIRLERGSFYADWVVEQTSKSARPRGALTPAKVVRLFTEDPSLSNQYFVRRQTRLIWGQCSDLERGRFLKDLFSRHRTDEFWVAMTRSLFLEECLPDIKKVKGLTQHDHYHRYTVETHLYKTIRETDRVCAKNRQLYSLRIAAKELKSVDWAILRWTALFHDIGKGREQDHSTVGAELVRLRLKKMGLPAGFIEEVAWMVTNHLLLTTAAFRQNASQPSTWKRLFDRGVTGDRIQRLIVFSAIDIRATNPEAWTSWKARLLSELYIRLRSPTAVRHQRFFTELSRKNASLPQEILNDLDTFLIESLPRQVLAEDLKKLTSAEEDLALHVAKHRPGQVWVRFHRKIDRPGLFLEFVQKLFWASARIDAASVMTLQPFGAYDWFLVRTSKSPRDLASRLSQGVSTPFQPKVPKVTFQSVEAVSSDTNEWILSFRGRDQKGLLLAAAQGLFDLGLAIHWARVHTWGSQIDDVFCVEAKGDLQNHLRLLQERFVT